jgi:hypothetical protein
VSKCGSPDGRLKFGTARGYAEALVSHDILEGSDWFSVQRRGIRCSYEALAEVAPWDRMRQQGV